MLFRISRQISFWGVIKNCVNANKNHKQKMEVRLVCLIMSDGSCVPMLIKAANRSYNGAEIVLGILRLDFAGESDSTVGYIDVSNYALQET